MPTSLRPRQVARAARDLTPAALAMVIALAGAAPARAGSDAIRVIASDASGITLRLETGPVTVAAGRTEGRSGLITSLLERTSQPGRPALPIATTLIALPPGAHAPATVLRDGEPEIRARVRPHGGS